MWKDGKTCCDYCTKAFADEELRVPTSVGTLHWLCENNRQRTLRSQRLIAERLECLKTEYNPAITVPGYLQEQRNASPTSQQPITKSAIENDSEGSVSTSSSE